MSYVFDVCDNPTPKGATIWATLLLWQDASVRALCHSLGFTGFAVRRTSVCTYLQLCQRRTVGYQYGAQPNSIASRLGYLPPTDNTALKELIFPAEKMK